MIDFTNEYNRKTWLKFFSDNFLPDDFILEEITVPYTAEYTQEVTKLGVCPSLELSVFEIRHKSTNDARVSLSKEAFRLVCDYTTHNHALLLFVPKNGADYRFSLVEFTPVVTDEGRLKREYSNPRRYSYRLGEGCKKHTPESMLITKGRIKSPEDMVSRFAIDVVTKEFYKELFCWYDEWAIDAVKFPQGSGSAVKLVSGEQNRIHLIRLITRLIFVWFIKQKKLIPDWIFDADEITATLKTFDSQSVKQGNYYNGIIQNLFFATLNKSITERGFAKNSSEHYGIKTYYRDQKDNPLFDITHDAFVQKFERVPFLNGGLFECLDKRDEREPQQYHDGFSQESSRAAFVPNCLFWGDKNHEGLIPLFVRYNFTVEENTPQDIEIALDPELLGKVFENLLGTYNEETSSTARKDSGSFYTPREIVDYMVDTSLKAYLAEKLSANERELTRIDEKLDALFSYNQSGILFTEEQVDTLIAAIDSSKILDPACGSGAFPMGILHKLVFILGKLDPGNRKWQERQIEKAQAIEDSVVRDKVIADIRISFSPEKNGLDYGRKLYLIENCIYGVDIQPIAIQISKLRFFISLIVDQKITVTKDDNYGVLPLPNLETKFVAANTLIGVQKKDESMALFENLEIEKLQKQLLNTRHRHFSAKTAKQKFDLRKDDKKICTELSELLEKGHYYTNQDAAQMSVWDPYNQNVSSAFFDCYWMFGVKDGFDVVIGNPPYVSTKGVSTADKKMLEQQYGFADDTYSHFFFKGINLLPTNGVVSFITPKTFWTTQTKRNLRALLLSKTIICIFDTADPFDAVMVDTCITTVKNVAQNNNTILFLDGSKNVHEPIEYKITQDIYLNTQNSVIFKPTPENLKINELYGQKVKDLFDTWWDKISTSKNITKNQKELELYRKSLKPGDLTLLGCLTEGGVGLQTGDNGKYIAVRKSTKWAKNILESRPKKLDEAIKKHKIKITALQAFAKTVDYLSSLSEGEIAKLFDELKEKYGRDIFGQGYLYRLVDDTEIADVEKLTQDEKENGIGTSKKYYVPYDKGDKDGNRWYLETPFAIAWSKENIRYLKTNSGKKGEGMPVVRNPQYNFREGFCWSDINTVFLKCRQKQQTINDVKSMSLYSLTDIAPEYYIICIINSKFMSYYVNDFINNTQTFQINDARQLPIVIPSKDNLEVFKKLFSCALEIKTSQFANRISNHKVEEKLSRIQEELDKEVNELYDMV